MLIQCLNSGHWFTHSYLVFLHVIRDRAQGSYYKTKTKIINTRCASCGDGTSKA